MLRAIFTQFGLPKNEPVVLLQSGILMLNPVYEITVDVKQFHALLAQAKTAESVTEKVALLEQAITLYSGELLAGSPYEEWNGEPREECKLAYIAALECLAAQHRQRGQSESAIALYQKLIEAEPANELAHRALMELFDADGHPERAILQYTACKRYLQRDLDAHPAPGTQSLFDRIVAGTRVRPSHQAVAATIVRSRYRAPAHAIELVGRQADLASLSEWLKTGSRLVTVTGTAGLGKTRLAHALAEQCQDLFVDGVLAVALTSLRNADQLSSHLAASAGVATSNDSMVQALCSYMSERQMLLVLDRFEHILAGVELVNRLLAAAPKLAIVVTSQVPLRCTAERVYALPSLWQSDPDSATQLFCQVAANLDVNIEGAEQLQVVRDICERLDGNALGIELAAAQTQVLGLREILSSLAKPLDMLTNPLVDVEDQHKSLRMAIAWSHQLLGADEQRIFAFLGVFAATFCLEDATEVLKDFYPAETTRAAIQTLMEFHLLNRVAAHTTSTPTEATPRFAYLDASKQFAQEMLARLTQRDEIQQAHAMHFAKLCNAFLAILRTGDVGEAKARFWPIHADALQSLEWHGAHADITDHLKLAYQAGALLLTCGDLSTTFQRLNQSLQGASPQTPVEKNAAAWCYYLLTRCYSWRLDHSSAIYSIRMARQLARDTEDFALTQRIGEQFATERVHQMKLRQALKHVVQLVHINLTHKNYSHLSTAYFLQAAINYQLGKQTAAFEACQLSLDAALKTSSAQLVGLATHLRADVLLQSGDIAGAQAALSESSLVCRQAFSHMHSFLLRLTDFAVQFESREFEKASEVLDAIAGQDQSGKEALYTCVLLSKDFLAIEKGNFEGASFIDRLDSDAFLFDANYSDICVRRWCYIIRVSALKGLWHRIDDSIEKLSVFLVKTSNPLWYSWFYEACAHALVVKGEFFAASEVLMQSRKLIFEAGFKATPRQQISWKEIEQRTQALKSPHTNKKVTLQFCDVSDRNSVKNLRSYLERYFSVSQQPEPAMELSAA
jgi:predicted ATPase/DNA-binding SARP family transcriptional activator